MRAIFKQVELLGARAKHVSIIKKDVYRVGLANGTIYCLKRMPCTSAHLHWIDNTLYRLKKRGFSGIAWGSPSGKRLMKPTRSGRRYVLAPWISGRWPKPRSPRDMRTCGMALAKFHKAGLRVRAPLKGADNQIGKWPSSLRSDQQLIAKAISIARCNGFSRPINRLLQQYGDEWIGYCRESRRLLRLSPYPMICRKHKKSRPLCHGDGGPSNFILNANGTFLIDFETLRFDLRAFDLYRFIYNACKDHNWEFRIASAFLDGYRSVSKLSRHDLELAKVWLRFPRTVYLLILELMNAKSSKSIEIGLKRAVAAERRIGPFLTKLDRYSKR